MIVRIFLARNIKETSELLRPLYDLQSVLKVRCNCIPDGKYENGEY